MMNKTCIFLVFLITAGIVVPLSAQKQVSFIAEDGLEVVADLYLKDKSFPFILLFHQAGASRGEYNETARKLLNLNYNCLAVDLRHGSKMNHAVNQTAQTARRKNYSHEQTEALKDIHAAIDYVYRQYQKPVILLGSVFSGSLAMVAATGNFKVQAVVAFNPGEYFRPHFLVKEKLLPFDKPLFIAASTVEKKYIHAMIDDIPENLISSVYLQEDKQLLGARVLWDEHPNSQQYWFELFVFFRDLKKNNAE